jgi:hypothetical protein
MIVHLVDGTYELFRHFYGLRRFTKGKDRPYGAVVGGLQTVLQMMTAHSPMLISSVGFEFEYRKNRVLKKGQAKPPLARNTWALIHPPSGPARKDTTPAMSSA